MLNKLFILILLGLLQFTQLHSQTPSYYHYTSSDGLASSTVFQIIQDRDGFIWFATQNGISKFDGKHFTSFSTKDGLNSNMITSLAVGNKGNIYFGSYEKGINVFRDGRIENYYRDNSGKQFYITFLLNASSENNADKLYANTRLAFIDVIYENVSNTPSKRIIYLETLTLIKLEKLLNNSIIVLTTKGLFTLRNDTIAKLRINGFPDTTVFCLADAGDGSFFIGTKGYIYRIKNNNVIGKYKISVGGNNEVSTIVSDKNNNLWFSVMNRGFFQIPKGTKHIIDIGSKMDLQSTNVNHLFEDNEGNIWVGTYGKGVFCLNNFFLNSYNENDGLSNNSVQSIVKEKSGKLFIGTFNGVNILDNGKFEQKKIDSESMLTEYINSIKIFDDNIFICGSFPKIYRKQTFYKELRLYFLNRQSFCKTTNGVYLFGSTGNSFYVHRDLFADRYALQVFQIFGDSARENRVNEIFEDTRKNIWVGTTLGLCKLSNFREKKGKAEWDKTFFPSAPVLNSRIKSIFQDNKSTVWFAGDLGIAKYDLHTDSVTEYTIINGYDLFSSTSITLDSKNRIWIGNMKGLYLFDGSSIKYLNSKTGLPTDEVLSLYYDERKNFLYVGTSNGLSILEIDLFDSRHNNPPKLKVTSIKAGDSVYTSYNNLVFEPEQHDVYIDFTALNFSSPGSVQYKYKLNDDEWKETDYDFLNLISLKNGTYNLQIIAKAQNMDWSAPVYLSFKILPRFIETIWFYIAIISVLVFVSVYIVTWRLRVRNKNMVKELDLTERINELKHQALSAMMNPHFIFNSLNSVQYLINCQRNEEANDYIAMMAKLIRKNLDTAGNAFILLAEEIKRLKLYLDLEKLRFQDKFSYELIIGNGVETDRIMIPNMIIQPFVENSLWHGIINSGKEGILTISFTFEDVDIDSIICKSLVIKITDNGIGINEAKKNIKEDHISKGIQIIEERLKLLSTKMELPQPIMFEDLSNSHNNSHGTEVIISLPLPLYKNISKC